MKEEHPDLFEQAKAYEKRYEPSGGTFTWSERESLAELEKPERVAAIKREHELRAARRRERRENLTLAQVFGDEDPEEDDDGCLICSL